MIDELNKAIKEYQTKWHALTAARTDHAFFKKLIPTSVGYKVADRSQFDVRVAELRGMCDEVVLVWMNERWIAQMILRGQPLEWQLPIVKIMQRRQGFSDAVGLDHIDFYSPRKPEENETILA